MVTVHSNTLNDYLDDLGGADGPEACMAAAQTHVEKLGMTNVIFSYTRRPRRIEERLPDYLRFSTVSENWNERYREMGYQNHCPLYRETLRDNTLPFIWQEVRDRIELDAMQQQVADEAASCGLAQGISIAIREANGDRCGIGFSTDLGAAEAMRTIKTHLPQLFIMGHHLHATMLDRYVEPISSVDIPELTISELDCLRWVADGMDTRDISEINGVSENTVKYHIRNILLKLGAGTRAAAVAKAFRAGILEI